MYTRTLLQLRTSFLRRGQWEGSSDLDPPGDKSIANELINDALEESYNIIVTRWDDYYTIVSTPIAVVSGTDTYTLPPDFYKSRKVEYLASGVATDPNARWARLYPIDVDDTHLERAGARRPKYRLAMGNVILVPSPQSTATIRVWYIAAAPQLVNDIDTVSFDTPVEQKLVLNIAMRDAYDRQDLPTADIEAKIAKLTAQLRTASDHDAGEPTYLTRRTGGGSLSGDPYQDDY